jgi:hypothetical protein
VTPDPRNTRFRPFLAVLCLLGAVAALIPSFFFWKAINPWFYDHLVATRCLYTLGFFFYFPLGCAELRRAPPTPAPL